MSDIKERIKNKLQESFISVKADFRNQKAKIMNLQHVGHGTYKNPAGHEFNWDDSRNDFILVKKNILKFPDLSQKGGRTRGDHPDNPTTPKDDEQINKFYKQQQTINKDKKDSAPKHPKEDDNSDIGFDPFELLKKPTKRGRGRPRKNVFDNPPEGGWTDADKVPLDKQTYPAQSSPEVIQKVKDHVKDVLSKPKDDFEIEEVEKESGRNVKLVSPNWALHVREGYGDISFKIYNNLENIGRKGKTVKETTLHFYLHPTEQVGRTAWNPTIVSRIKDAKPKSPEDLEKFIEDQINKVKAEEPKTKIYPKREDELKGIDRDIPDFGLEGDYKDFSGKDINVKYKKPTINITSNKRTERSDNYYNSGYDVKWNYAKKLKKIEDQLKDAENEEQIVKLLDDNGIKYKSYMYSRWD